MQSARALAGIVIGATLIATAPAHAAGPSAPRAPAAPTLAAPTAPPAFAVFDWAAMLDRTGAQLATWMLAPTTWAPSLHDLPIALMVEARDLIARLSTRTTALLALLPAPSIPDLTVLTTSPVPDVESSGFGWRMHPILHYNKFHAGTDFKADRGTPVYAAGTGVVAFAGVRSGYGKLVMIDHGGGVLTRYAHLSSIDVKAGATIAAAVRLGRVGSTGRATGPHLHFEVRLDDRPVDPTMALKVAALQRTDAAAARLAAWTLTPEAMAQKVDRHAPPRAKRPAGKRPERRGAPTRDRNRS
ncbi:MAG: M23 family metallopeptidase [Myxococcales bacterium]|nr:M23 family metallopeptidase [Myxococcales bacterium]